MSADSGFTSGSVLTMGAAATGATMARSSRAGGVGSPAVSSQPLRPMENITRNALTDESREVLSSPAPVLSVAVPQDGRTEISGSIDNERVKKACAPKAAPTPKRVDEFSVLKVADAGNAPPVTVTVAEAEACSTDRRPAKYRRFDPVSNRYSTRGRNAIDLV